MNFNKYLGISTNYPTTNLICYELVQMTSKELVNMELPIVEDDDGLGQFDSAEDVMDETRKDDKDDGEIEALNYENFMENSDLEKGFNPIASRDSNVS